MKKILLLFSLITALSVLPVATSHAADPLNKACDKLGSRQQESSACSANSSNNPISGGKDGILYKITQLIAVIAGSVAVIIIIIGGINMMTSGGDSQKFTNGRNTLIFAAVGLVIIVLAQWIVAFVIQRALP